MTVEVGAARERPAEVRCAYCRDALHASDAAEACPGCATRLHVACRAELSRCPVLGCAVALPGSVVARPGWGAILRAVLAGLVAAGLGCWAIERWRPWDRPRAAGRPTAWHQEHAPGAPPRWQDAEALAASLQDPDVGVRRAAVGGLLRMSLESALPAGQFMGDPSASFTDGHLYYGRVDEPVARALADEDPIVRRTAARILIGMQHAWFKDKNLAQARAWATNPDPTVRAGAARILAVLHARPASPPGEEGALLPLLELTNDSDVEVRAAARRGLKGFFERWDGKGGVRPLPPGSVEVGLPRLAALLESGRNDGHAHWLRLTCEIWERERNVRPGSNQEVVAREERRRVLAARFRTSALRCLGEEAHARDALLLLAGLGAGAEDVGPALVAAFRAGDAERRAEVVRTCCGVGQAARAMAPLLLEHLQRALTPQARREVVAALGALGASEATSLLLGGLASEDRELRGATARALARFARLPDADAAAAVPALERALGDYEHAIRCDVVRALFAVQAPHQREAALRAALRCLDDPHQDVREAVAQRLRALGPADASPQAIAALKEALRGAGPEGREALQAALRAIGPR